MSSRQVASDNLKSALKKIKGVLKMESDGLRKAVETAGSISKLARALGITPQAVWQWREVPVRHVISIERIFGVPREELRPDLYRRD